MDSRIYFHQYRRPRNSNPTYVSSNVNQSITSFDATRRGGNSSQLSHYNKMDSYDSYSLSKRGEDNQRAERYHTIGNFANEHSSPLQAQSRGIICYQIAGNSLHANNRASHLSTYGTTSLQLTQNEIFNKQNARFNIITMQPKEYDTSIRQHPKFSIQNKDELYYRRMRDEGEKRKMYGEVSDNNRRGGNDGRQEQVMIAGKHTYEREKNVGGYTLPMTNPEMSVPHYTKPVVPLSHKPGKEFTPKLLSHMDELLSLS